MLDKIMICMLRERLTNLLLMYVEEIIDLLCLHA